MHRWQHKNLFLWRIHEAHHSTKDVDWLSGSRSHAFEILINQTVEFMPIILLGAAPEVALYKGMISAIWGMYIHSNIDIPKNNVILKYIINGPQMHRWHHSAVVEHGRHNFATKFAFWDWIFGTAMLPSDRNCDEYGIAEVNFPKDYLSQTAFAFRKFDEIDLKNYKPHKKT